MPKAFKKNIVNRILDANLNRAKEGLRVCEEIARFILSSRYLTREFKKIRHKISAITKTQDFGASLIKERYSRLDVGKDIYINELKRKDFRDIFFANIQRSKESIRVLEEFTKLMNKKTAVGFKNIRYGLYDIEKKAAKLLALSNP